MIAYWGVTVPYSNASGPHDGRNEAIAKGHQGLRELLAEKGIAVSEQDIHGKAHVSETWNTSSGESFADATDAYVHVYWPNDIS